MQKGAIFLSVWANPSKPGHQELLAPLPQAGKHPARVIGPVGGFNQLFWGCGSAPDYHDQNPTQYTQKDLSWTGTQNLSVPSLLSLVSLTAPKAN